MVDWGEMRIGKKGKVNLGVMRFKTYLMGRSYRYICLAHMRATSHSLQKEKRSELRSSSLTVIR